MHECRGSASSTGSSSRCITASTECHFHATYAGETAVISIQTDEVIAGRVPARALRLIQEWCEMHRDELRLNWARARDNAPLVRIDPLP
jgi:hypothetical protein